METEQIAQEGIADIVARVAGAMEAAVKDYGPDAVDLALLAYRVDAAQSLLFGALSLAGVVASWVLWLQFKTWLIDGKEENWGDPDIGFPLGMTGGVLCVVTAFAGIGGLIELFSVTRWMAVFGYPELLIATKALQAAGLM